MDSRNYKYEVSCESLNDTVQWIVRYPDLPGIIGSGDTEEEALKEAKENKDFYLDYLEDTHKPFPIQTTNEYDVSGKITLRMSKSTHRKLINQSEKEGISLNQLINEALVVYIERKSTIEACSEMFFDLYNKEFYNDRKNNIIINYQSPYDDKVWDQKEGNLI